MIDAINMAHLSMDLDQMRLRSVAQNIANMQTPGYKRELIQGSGFDDALLASMERVAESVQSTHVHEQGTLRQTGHSFDIAVSGDGYFQVMTEEGIRYTRRGDFQLNKKGELTTQSGDAVLGTNGTIYLDSANFSVDKRGNISIDHQKIAQLNIVKFSQSEHLRYIGRGLFKSDVPAEPVEGSTSVLQGFVEQSNVKSVDEMMELIKISRHFEASQRIVRMADALRASVINQLGESNV